METEAVHINGAAKAAPTPKKKSALKGKAPTEAIPSKPKILIYGKPGVGKTWGALEFPGVYYIDTEGGANLSHYMERLQRAGGAYFGPEDGSLDPKTVLEQIQALATEEHGYRTVVFDSLSKLWMKMVSDEAERLGEKDAFGASKKPAIAWMRRLLNWIDKLDMNVVFICHEKDVWGDQKKLGETFDAWDKLAYELHLALHIQKRGAARVAVPTKSRLEGFPENTAFPWSFAEFETRYGKEVIERESKPIEIASAEQVAEIYRLLEVVKMPEEEIAKWFTKAKVDTWTEMDCATIQKCVNFLKNKVEGK